VPIARSAREHTTSILKIGAVFFTVSSVITYLFSLALGPLLFYYTSDGLKIAARGIQQIPLLIFMALPIQLPIHSDMGNLFGIIWLIFVLCTIAAWYSRGGFVKSLRNTLREPILSGKINFLLVMPLIAVSLLSATILISQFQAAQGVQTGNLTFPPETSPYVILINLAYAPIDEEVAFRITSIGIPCALFLLYLHRKDPKVTGVTNRLKLLLVGMISPEHAKAMVGYRTVAEQGYLRGISPLEWMLILITSIAFGLAHYLLGGGWEIGKVSTALLAGLVFGIMFVAYGAYAAILLHWYFDYFFTIVNLAETTYGGVFHAFSSAIEITNIIGGQLILVILLIVWALRTAGYLSNRAVRLNE
jgi:hypothetical protein